MNNFYMKDCDPGIINVSVAICTWNRARLLEKTLESFLNLRIPEGVSWELLLVNNACTDDTDQVAEKFIGKLPLVLCHESKPGKSNAHNYAIANAKGEFILWTDDDVRVDSGWLTETLKAFDIYKADLVYGKILPWWEEAPPIWYSEKTAGIFACIDYGPEPFVVTEQEYAAFGPNMAMRLEAFRKLGGYSNEVSIVGNSGIGGEDLEMFYRFMDHGMRVVYTPYSVVEHFISKVRCTKSIHRSRTWAGSHNNFKLLQIQKSNAPHILSLPRYYYSMNINNLWRYLAAVCRRNSSEAFFYELKMIRFLGLLWHALRNNFQKKKNNHTL